MTEAIPYGVLFIRARPNGEGFRLFPSLVTKQLSCHGSDTTLEGILLHVTRKAADPDLNGHGPGILHQTNCNLAEFGLGRLFFVERLLQ